MRSEPLRVAQHVIRFPKLTETFILNQITGLLERGHEVDIYARQRGKAEELPPRVQPLDLMSRVTYGAPVRNTLLRRVFSLPLVERAFGPLSRMAPERRAFAGGTAVSPDAGHGEGSSRASAGVPWWGTRYDIIHAQFGTVALKSLLARQLGLLRGRLITSFRGYDATWWPTGEREGIYGGLFRQGDLFLPVSDSLRDRLVDLGCDPARIRVHPSGVDTGAIAYRAPSWSAGRPLRLACVGRLVEKKGFIHAVRALARLREAGHDVHLDLVGQGPLRDALVEQVREAGMADRVALLGRRSHDEVLEVLRQSNILWVPSVTAANGDQEGIPNVAKEAMAIGLPVIATRHGGLPELIEDGGSGVLVPEADDEALAAAVETLMRTPESWIPMTEAARKSVEERYDSERLNDALVGIYREVAGR